MKTVSIELSDKLTSVELHTASDWHIGDKFCDLSKIKEELKQIAETPNAYLICNGDLCNNATKNSVSDSYSEQMSPMEQLNIVISLLEPIKDKVLLLTQGNHEARTFREDGIDLTMLIAKQLGIEDRYVREGGVLFLRFGRLKRGMHKTSAMEQVRKACYTIYVTHGSGSGRKAGGKMNRLVDISNIVDTDIVVMGHAHQPAILRSGFYRVDRQNNAVAYVDKLFVSASSQLDYGGYGEVFNFQPTSKQTPVIYLDGTVKKYTARM